MHKFSCESYLHGNWNFRSHVLLGAKVPQVELSLPGTFAPWNSRSLELSFPGMFAPWDFHILELWLPWSKYCCWS